ncbi:ArsA-related P-loop ATPase [Oleidesulfovibrio sp.]|uniref:ATP-binding protein n=1 Tax=Oleidesulfovibrio sp. TaxID=2909707 RepID=UPI003A8C132C
MKLAFAGKGGVGKTSITAWMADWLARCGRDVWMIDADTALSLGQASGLSPQELPQPLIARKDLVQERIHAGGFLNLNPDVDDLPAKLAVDVPVSGAPLYAASAGRKRLLVMGALTNAGGGCACDGNALLKALLAHIVMDASSCVLVDLEAGVEHLGRGTVAHVDGLVVVSEPSMRSLQTAAEVSRMATDLQLHKQALVLNRFAADLPVHLPDLNGLPRWHTALPPLHGLISRQLTEASVLNLPEQTDIDRTLQAVASHLGFIAQP